MLLSVSGIKHLWKVGKRILEKFHGILCLHQQSKQVQDMQSPVLPKFPQFWVTHHFHRQFYPTLMFIPHLTLLVNALTKVRFLYFFLFSEQSCWKGKGRISIKIVIISFCLGFVLPCPGYWTLSKRQGHTRASPVKRNWGLSAAHSNLMWWYREGWARLFSEMLSD